MGFFTVTRDGTITRLNLAAAGLLGLRSTDPGGRRLGAYLGGASLDVFNGFLARLFDTACGRCASSCWSWRAATRAW